MRHTHYNIGNGVHRDFFKQPHLLGQFLNSKIRDNDHLPPMPIDPRFNASLVRPLGPVSTPIGKGLKNKKKPLSFKF